LDRQEAQQEMTKFINVCFLLGSKLLEKEELSELEEVWLKQLDVIEDMINSEVAKQVLDSI
jgi:hypothetical protein